MPDCSSIYVAEYGYPTAYLMDDMGNAYHLSCTGAMHLVDTDPDL